MTGSSRHERGEMQRQGQERTCLRASQERRTRYRQDSHNVHIPLGELNDVLDTVDDLQSSLAINLSNADVSGTPGRDRYLLSSMHPPVRIDSLRGVLRVVQVSWSDVGTFET